MVFYDPAMGRRTATPEDERTRTNAEREARINAEASVRDLEELLRHLNP